jgi:hypothetical protein
MTFKSKEPRNHIEENWIKRQEDNNIEVESSEANAETKASHKSRRRIQAKFQVVGMKFQN